VSESAALTSAGSSFHHCGARTEQNREELGLGQSDVLSPSSSSTETELADGGQLPALRTPAPARQGQGVEQGVGGGAQGRAPGALPAEQRTGEVTGSSN